VDRPVRAEAGSTGEPRGRPAPGAGSALDARASEESARRISRRHGDNWAMADAMLGLALLAGDADDWDRAAVLHGAAQAFLDRVSNQWDELAVRYRRDSLGQARAHLGDEQLERAYPGHDAQP
jgi:hypothetical protein